MCRKFLGSPKQVTNKFRPDSIAAGESTFQVGEKADSMTKSTDPDEESQTIEPGKRQPMTKADLLNIRESHVDLDEIVRRARKQNSNS
jgi:uncharacterized protein YmfQ (DUF2313 family)